MTKLLHLDTETYSPTAITAGTHRYAEDVEVMVFAYGRDDGEIKSWDRTADDRMPAELEDSLLDERVQLVCHNSHFDRTVIRHSMGLDLPPERWFDTMVCAMAHSLPGSLEKLGEIFKLPQDQRKLKIGKDLVQLFCKPRPKNMHLRRATRHTHPVEWAKFVEYAAHDVIAMRALYHKMPKWNYPREQELWALDQRINDRGFAVDMDLVLSLIHI